MRKILRPALLCILIFLCGGIIFDPFWWYRLIRQREYTSWELWLEPVNYAIAMLWWIFFTVVTIYSVLVLSKTEIPDKLLFSSKIFWNDWVLGRKLWRIYTVILVLMIAGLLTAGLRSRDEQKLQTDLRESQESLAKSQLELKRIQKDASDKNKPPLSEPTAFLFLDKDVVESLYGQYSPDLQRSAVIDEITNSRDIKGEVTIEDFLKTSAGQQYLQKQISQN